MKINHYPKLIVVEALKSPLRIDKYLSHILSELSRNEISKNLKEGNIKVNGKQVKPSYLLKGKEEITLYLTISTIGEQTIIPLNLIPEPEILYENQDFLVINKPAGVNAHPTLQNLHEPSIASWFIYKYPQAVNIGENKLRPGIVHRLDKDTSGALILVKTQSAFLYFKELFLNKKIQKQYLVLVKGEIKKEKGVIEFGLTRSTTSGKRKIILLKEKIQKKVKNALTFYEVKERYHDYTLLKVEPRTGRTHQIRIHLASIGFPVAGDKIYGASSKNQPLFRRQMLHAQKIVFMAPNHQQLSIEAPLPNDFKQTLTKLVPIAKN